MFNFFKIAANTFRESIREPVFFLMLFCALVLIGHYPSAALFVFSEQLKLVVDSSMATALIFGLVAGVLCASHTVAREMRNGTVLLLLSKPVYRWNFILGKIAGILVAVTLFTAVCNFAGIIAVYVATDQFRMDMGVYYIYLGLLVAGCIVGMLANFFRGSSFPEITSYALTLVVPCFAVYCLFAKPEPTISLSDLGCALVLINFATIAMATLAVVFATRLDIVANLCVCTVVFFLGLVSSYLFQRETGSDALNLLFGFLYAVIPNWQYFWLADAIAVNRPIPLSYVVGCAVYVVIYVCIAAMWAVAVFQNKEVAGDNRV